LKKNDIEISDCSASINGPKLIISFIITNIKEYDASSFKLFLYGVNSPSGP